MPDPNNPNVTVSFVPGRSPQFTFDKDSVKLTAAGNVVLNRNPGESWTFTGATVKNPPNGQFGSPVVTPASVEISDACSVKGSWGYSVTVSLNGTSYTSPDPEIVNDPASPMPKPPTAPPPPPQPKPPEPR